MSTASADSDGRALPRLTLLGATVETDGPAQQQIDALPAG